MTYGRHHVVAIVAGFVLLSASAVPARAATISIFGNSTTTSATATANLSFDAQTNTLTFSILNTSPFDARITGIGFDLLPTGNANGSSGLDGFTGSVVSAPSGVAYVFSDAAVGNVPQLNSAVLDFAFLTGSNFAGGSPNDGLAPGTAPGGAATFIVSGSPFAGFTEASIAQSLYVRFQRVGSDGEGSDVGIPGAPGPLTSMPEPGTLTLLGLGGAAAAWRKRRTKKMLHPR